MEGLPDNLSSQSDEDQQTRPSLLLLAELDQRIAAMAPDGSEPVFEGTQDISSTRSLAETIEGEIIPRFLLTLKDGSENALTTGQEKKITSQDHDLFVQYLLHNNARSARNYFGELLERGVAIEDLFLELLPKAARRLGDMWDKDLCGFAEVTLGTCRLHEILRTYAASPDYDFRRPSGEGPRILLSTACADQHILGVMILADFFRRAGWRVVCQPGATCKDLAKILSARAFDIVGLSASSSVRAEGMTTDIRALRAASTNKNLKVLVGGRLFDEDPSLAEKIGADAFTNNVHDACKVVEQLLAAKSVQC